MLVTALTIAQVVYVVVLAVWIMLEKRSPLATLAWIFALAALPLLGFPIYYLLGPRSLRRKRTRRARALRRIRASLPDVRALLDPTLGKVRERVDPTSRQLITLALNNSESPLSTGNSVRLLKNGTECFPAIEEAIRKARHHVHLEYYTVEPDTTGMRLRDLLVEKARAGVQVRLLVDDVGSLNLDDRFFAPLTRAGGEVGVFNPATFARLRPKLNFRNHRKIVVCDGEVAFTGGLNVADCYAGLVPGVGVWRDTHVRVEGPAAKALQLLFLEDWNFATGHSVGAPFYFGTARAPGDELVQILGSGPDRDWQAVHQVFFAAVASAEDRVLVTTPYFVPDESMLTALTTAALRGVDVKLLLPRRIDSRTVLFAGRSYYDELLRAGVRIWEYLPGFLHAKTLAVDGKVGMIGSANMDQRSFRLNFEVTAMIFSAAVAGEMETIFEQDLTVSREITLQDRQAMTFPQRLVEASARLLSPLL